jgi:hypothetical protein
MNGFYGSLSIGIRNFFNSEVYKIGKGLSTHIFRQKMTQIKFQKGQFKACFLS